LGRKQDCFTGQDDSPILQRKQLARFFDWVLERFDNMDSDDPCRRRYEMDREACEDAGGIHVDLVIYKGIPLVPDPAAFEELHKGNNSFFSYPPRR
jgi:hypothetical protein